MTTRLADSPTLRDGLDRHRNSLNFLRLVLAGAVIVEHTWTIGGYGDGPQLGRYTLGNLAVYGFFAISGYLIAASRMHHTGPRFLVRRILRIYPGFLVCLVVTAVVFAPLATMIGPGSLHVGSAVGYVRENLLLKINTYDIAHTLDSVPYPKVWNGSLWTLRYEFLCYLVVGVLLTFVRFRVALTGAVFAVAFVTSAVTSLRDVTGVMYELGALLSVFAAGSLLALWAHRIRFDNILAALAVVVLGVSVPLHLLPSLGAFPLCYLILWLGRVLPFSRVGRHNDISYGVYIYGMPITQLLVLLDGNRLPVLVLAALAVVVTVPFAAASWFAVERPALRLAPRVDRQLAALAGRGPSWRTSGGGLLVLAGSAMSLYPALTLAREMYYKLR